MILAKPKPIEEIASCVSEYRKVLILGCGSCVTICLSGGDKEVRALTRELSQARYYKEDPPFFNEDTILRQCERDLVKTYLKIPSDTEAILSLGCGAGVQTVAEVFQHLPVIPALNTTFLGGLDEPGVWREKCQGCGNCVLAYTRGICPVTRCAKRLLNGPCGGSSNGKCEIGGEIDCAWQLIIDRLKALGKLDEYEKTLSIRDWSSDRAAGPRMFTSAETLLGEVR